MLPSSPAYRVLDSPSFCVRCAAHSLQLILKDFEKQIPAVSAAVQTARHLLDEHASTPERTAKFLLAQTALGLAPKQLCRIGQTRWNSIVDCWRSMIQLRPVINALGIVTTRDWDSVEKALLLCEPVAVATDRIQGDDCTSTNLLQVCQECMHNAH